MASANFPLSYTAPKTDAMNADTMTSPEAERARQRSAEIMATLKKGGPQAAEDLMATSERKPEGNGVVQAEKAKAKAKSGGGLGGWFKAKMGGGMKGGQGEERVVR